MNWSLGAILGLASIGLLLVLVARGPRLAGMGYTEALRRPKQLPLIAVGLMLATTIATFAGVMSDTTSDAIEDEVLGRLGTTDVLLHGTDGAPFEAAVADAALARPEVAFQVQDALVTIRWPVSIQNTATGLGSGAAYAWGVPPAETDLLPLARLEGEVPDRANWPADAIVVNADLADELDARPGHQVTVYVRPAAVAASHLSTDHVTTAGTHWRVVDVPDGARRLHAALAANPDAATSAGSNLTLRITDPAGDTRLLVHGNTSAGLEAALHHADLAPGAWNITATLRNDTAAMLAVNVTGAPATAAPVAANATIVGIIRGTGSDAVAAGPRIYLPQATLGDLAGSRAIANVVQVDAFRDATLPRLTRDLHAGFHAESADNQNLVLGKAGSADTQNVRGITAREADAAGRAFREDTLFYGSFNLLAGFLLIVVLMALLVEERRKGLAALRATGAGRRDLTVLHIHEGSVYAVFATLLGLLGGLALAALYARLDPLRQGDPDLAQLDLVISPQTLVDAAGIGFFLTLVGIAFATVRLVRFNVARGLRGLEDKRRRLGALGLLGYWVAIAGAAAGVWWANRTDNDGAIGLLAPVALLLLAAGLLGRRLPRQIVYPATGAALVAFTLWQYVTLDRSDLLERDLALVPIRALMLVAGTTLFVVWSGLPARLATLLARQFRGLDPIADASLGYPQSERTRTALTVAMLGIVVVMLIVLSTFNDLSRDDADLDAAGFDIVADADAIIDLDAFLVDHPPADGLNPFRNARGVHAVTVLEAASGDARIDGAPATPRSGDIIGVQRGFADTAQFTPRAIDARYLDVADALAAITTDPDLAATAGLRVGGGPDPRPAVLGDRVVLPGGAGTVTVIAVLEGGDFGDLLVHPNRIAAQPATHTRLFVHGHDDTPHPTTAKQIEAGLRAARVDAHAVSDLEAAAADSSATQQAFARLFVGMGLVAGIASIGIITSRNVLERRSIIGVLRAVGAKRRQVAAIFAVETLFVATMALVVGITSGLAIAYATYRLAAPDRYAAWQTPWATTAWLTLLVVGTALAMALYPALRASNIPPAQATRYAE